MSQLTVAIPLEWDDAGLTVWQFRLLLHIARVGRSIESVRTIAESCLMSTGQASQELRWLIEQGFLVYTTGPGGKRALVVSTSRSSRRLWLSCRRFCRTPPARPRAYRTGEARSSEWFHCCPFRTSGFVFGRSQRSSAPALR